MQTIDPTSSPTSASKKGGAPCPACTGLVQTIGPDRKPHRYLGLSARNYTHSRFDLYKCRLCEGHLLHHCRDGGSRWTYFV